MGKLKELKKISNFVAVRTLVMPDPVTEIAADASLLDPVPDAWRFQPTGEGFVVYWNATGIAAGNVISLDVLVPNASSAPTAGGDHDWVIAAQFTNLVPGLLGRATVNFSAIVAIRVISVTLAAGTDNLYVWAAKA